MAKRGGYTRNVEGIEWAKLSEQMDAQGKLSAGSMGQTYYTWLNDAVAHHVYRCEMIQAKQRYAQACQDAAASMRPSPLEADYMPAGPAPTITRSAPGAGGSPGRGPAGPR